MVMRHRYGHTITEDGEWVQEDIDITEEEDES